MIFLCVNQNKKNGGKMKKVLFIGFLMLFAFAQFAFAQELLTNEGFENWTVNGAGGPPDDWELSSTSSFSASQEATTIHGGTYSTNLTWSTTSNRDFRQIDIPVSPDQAYTFSAWVYDNDTAGRAALYIRWEDSGGSYISNSSFVYSEDNVDWQQVSTGLATSPSNAAQCEVRIRCYDYGSWDGDATIYVDDASLQASTTVEINKAYSISDTEIDVIYTNDVTSVDPADYTLTGTATITFSGATIDGSDAKIVHLTGASPTIDGDRILDNIDDSANSSNYDFYAGIMPIMYTNTSTPGGTVDGTHFATYEGIVSADDEHSGVWFSDNFGAYNGVLIYDYDFGDFVSVGDEILIIATRTVYSSLTELVNPELISTISTGNTPWGPTVINGSDIDETLAADTNPGEIYEGQLCKIENFVVESYTAYDYRCMWEDPITRDTYYFHVGDNVDYHFSVVSLDVGSTYTEIVGVIDWYNTDGNYRINPRDADDYIIFEDITPPTIASVSVTDENTVEVNFDEDVEEITAETTTNYTIVARDVTVTGAVLDVGDATHVTLTVTGMTVGDYTLSAVGVQDLSGNPSNDSENFSYYLPADVLINEVDADTPGNDAAEFIELYDGGVGNQSLDGYVVVLYNGLDDQSYTPAIDLDGYTTDENGYFVIGSIGMGTDIELDPGGYGWLQNGADAVALYFGYDDTDFPNDTPVTATNLIDAIVYDTNDNDDAGLLDVLLNPGQPQVNEDGNGAKDTDSNQRIPNGAGGEMNTDTYTQATSTPGAENAAAPDPPTNVTISAVANGADTDVTISWDAVAGASSYTVYRTADPYATFPDEWTAETGITETSWSYTTDRQFRFYRVTANN